ncbi:MAG TPA: DUF29 family protein [Nostoc sp.]|uniref:DUF29 family protein n=1 Tax=Nostoc sp. TaxID=1180 RepID=UPI002D5D1CE7|nr:DUF29 family protein [Nostoc sp.]HYX15705.1 DUF29 family protein [Nostoc sp.]
MNNQLYEQNFNLWRESIIEQIKEHRFNDIDWEHLLIELEDMRKSDKWSFISQLLNYSKIRLPHQTTTSR